MLTNDPKLCFSSLNSSNFPLTLPIPPQKKQKTSKNQKGAIHTPPDPTHCHSSEQKNHWPTFCPPIFCFVSPSPRSELNRWSAEIGGEIHETSQQVAELRRGRAMESCGGVERFLYGFSFFGGVFVFFKEENAD